MNTTVTEDSKIKLSTDKLLKYIEENSSYKKILYLDLGVKKIRLVCYSELFIPHIKKQLTYSLSEKALSFDKTIILWNENNLEQIQENKDIFVYDTGCENLSDYCISDNTISTYCANTETYFYGVKNLEPEEFIKEGHIFVQIFYKILKTENTNLVHGACIGLDNKGILLCARGQRGKSTLAVLSMLEGFEYVSDDYLTLQKENDKLYAYPIYSIITLSPKMYNILYDKLDGTRFISNNARKDKYVINIANHHNQFKKKYPISVCMSLEFTSEENPSITELCIQEKGKAITQLVHSTVTQMREMYDTATIKKMIGMINNFKFYKINLCNNIYKNVECLKKFEKEQIID